MFVRAPFFLDLTFTISNLFSEKHHALDPLPTSSGRQHGIKSCQAAPKYQTNLMSPCSRVRHWSKRSHEEPEVQGWNFLFCIMGPPGLIVYIVWKQFFRKLTNHFQGTSNTERSPRISTWHVATSETPSIAIKRTLQNHGATVCAQHGALICIYIYIYIYTYISTTTAVCMLMRSALAVFT